MDSFSGSFGSGDQPASRTGPPWEQPGPFVTRYIDTAKGVLLDPNTFFGSMRRQGGLGAPLMYGLLGLVIGIVASVVSRLMLPMGPFSNMGPFGNNVGVAAGGFVMSIVLAPIYAVCALFIVAGIVHLVLMLVGGAKFGFETTFRVIAYANGSTGPIGIVPFCGGLIAAVWAIVVMIIGLATAHETTTGKAAVAVLLPIVLCCVVAAVFAIMFAALAASFFSNQM